MKSYHPANVQEKYIKCLHQLFGLANPDCPFLRLHKNDLFLDHRCYLRSLNSKFKYQ